MEDVKASNFAMKDFEVTSDIKVNISTILVVDKTGSLVVEKKDDSKVNVIDAIVLATYSTSTPKAISCFSIFESLYTQVKLHGQLKIHDNIQVEYI